MAEVPAVEEAISPAQSPLVTLTFQKHIHRKEKYLEAEPKALGVLCVCITQISLSVFTMLSTIVFLSNWGNTYAVIPFFISSLLVIIAGSVAVAAKNLHLPTLRACLVMQILACVASIVNIVCTLIKDTTPYYCWHSYMMDDGEICHKIEKINAHFCAGGMLIQATLFAISVTLAAYCCKVVNCCGPPAKLPVITVQAPPAQE
ncbi:uncharacterized protein LOC102784997 isoform X2 [Neolamprologus brichardi]|uniref:uncharacterized protein LOC102784997 isoform X2 n=1 Tax=Neolamprologus brichardi TaxID=32507 RepID=UPI001643C405|nr:uncharacterized protein LOC102784997 isoform X2 [Neolamprologus brichardi]